MKKIIFLGLACILFTSCNEAKKANGLDLNKNIDLKEALTAELDSIHENGLLNGFSVAIVNGKGTLYEKGFGYSNIETKEKYTKNTIQHIASISKTLIGVALMKAQELGHLNLDDPIQNYLPFKVINPFHPNIPITIRHLASHTSGINDTEQYMDNAWIIAKNQDLTNISTDYPEQRLNMPEKNVPMAVYLQEYLTPKGKFYQEDNYINFKPGKNFNYSNVAATLAALVIEKATTQKFDLFTQHYILKPLGMTASGWSLYDVDISKHSRLYRTDNSVLPFYTAITYPDGMLISSSSDMAKYLTELIKGYSGEGTLLKKESYKELFTKQLNEAHFGDKKRNADNPYNDEYNSGIFMGFSALGYIGHSGGDAGVGTWLFFDENTKTGRYIVKNTDSGNDNRARELEYYAIWDKMKEYEDKLKN